LLTDQIVSIRSPASPSDPGTAHERDRADLDATASGDRSAFEALYRRYHPLLLRFLRRFTTRVDAMEDVVNETMLVVWRTAEGFRGQSKVSTWIIGIAYRCMLSSLRHTPSWLSIDDVQQDDDGGESARYPQMLHTDSSPQRELHNWLEQGLMALPEEQRVTLELAYYMGQSCEEIAAIMGCPVGTVKARMFHARAKLRSVLPVLGGDVPRQAAGKEARL
jgi:RNA polymerase sigma-70 factor (ECF subfamily)